MHIISVIQDSHALPLHHRAMKKLIDLPAGIANPVYEIKDFLRDRIILDPPKHNDIWCDNPKCPDADVEDVFISGFRYYCIDCVPDQVNFCSACVALPGQGIEHDPTHRLLQLLPTECAICQGIALLKWHEGDTRGPHKEYSAPGAALNRVAEARSCAFCTFIWNALLQHPLDDIRWPPTENQEVKIRIRMRLSDWLEIAVVSDVGVEESNVEVCGEMFTIRRQNSGDMESALQVGQPLKLSHQTSINPVVSNDHQSKASASASHLARVQQYSGSDESLILAKRWLDNCRERHITCKDVDLSLMPPTRVIDLLGKDSSRVYLRETKGETCEYAALSYCWGPGAPGLLTSKSNLASHCEDGIEIGKLPKTIQDAIFATRKLDIRFLWVDRLCIIQDSKEDWTHQAALMCAVYSGATLTLSADGSDCATNGLFQTDQALSKLNYQKYCGPNGDDTVLVLTDLVHHPSVGTRFLSSNQPIDSRGWTMQERLMSRRVLHFTSNEMVWECDTLTECECRRQSHASDRHFPVRTPQEKEYAYLRWRMIAQVYAMRAFRCESDKMPALRGLVEKFQLLLRDIPGADSEPPDDYLAGLWKGDLMAQLAWKPPSKADLEFYKKAANRRITEFENMEESSDVAVEDWRAILDERTKHEDRHELEEYIAPSWSWAHLRGPISYHFCFPSSPFVSYAEVIEARVKPIDPDEPTGQLSSGFITLSGRMVRGMHYMSSHGIYDDGERKDIGWLIKEKCDYRWSIWFQPDNCTGLKRRRGNELIDVTVFLLGRQDLDPPEGEKGVTVGNVSPIRLTFDKQMREAQADVLETGGVSLDITGSSPEEPLDLFGQDTQDGRVTYRWSSFLVLVESEQQRGKYERIGCFDVCSEDKESREVLETLFRHSKKEQITII